MLCYDLRSCFDCNRSLEPAEQTHGPKQAGATKRIAAVKTKVEGKGRKP